MTASDKTVNPGPGSSEAPAPAANPVSSAGVLFDYFAQLAMALETELHDISVGEGSVMAAQALAARIGWLADEAASACKFARMRDGAEWMGGGPWATTCLGDLQQAAKGMA
jgi:hypothetical protein